MQDASKIIKWLTICCFGIFILIDIVVPMTLELYFLVFVYFFSLTIIFFIFLCGGSFVNNWHLSFSDLYLVLFYVLKVLWSTPAGFVSLCMGWLKRIISIVKKFLSVTMYFGLYVVNQLSNFGWYTLFKRYSYFGYFRTNRTKWLDKDFLFQVKK